MSSTLVSTFGAMCKMMLILLKWPVILFFVVLIIFYLDCLFWYYRRYRKGDRVQRGSVRPLVKRPALLPDSMWMICITGSRTSLLPRVS